MRVKSTAPDRLSDHLKKLLVDGPFVHGLTYHDLPPHEELRAAWRAHGDVLKRAHPRRRLWFEERDQFIRWLNGEP